MRKDQQTDMMNNKLKSTVQASMIKTVLLFIHIFFNFPAFHLSDLSANMFQSIKYSVVFRVKCEKCACLSNYTDPQYTGAVWDRAWAVERLGRGSVAQKSLFQLILGVPKFPISNGRTLRQTDTASFRVP